MTSRAADDVLWVMTYDNSRLLFVSPAYERVWGRSIQSLYDEPRSFVEAAHPDDRAALFEAFARQLAGEAFTHEYRIVRPDGSICWVWAHGYPVNDERGEPRWFVGLAQDVTERRRMAERLEMISHACDQGVWEWDIVTGGAWWSEANYQLYGYGHDVVPSHQAWADRVHPEDRERVISSITTALATGATTWSGEYRAVSTRGTVHEVLDRASIQRAPDGTPTRMAGAVVDVTELRKLERQLRHTQKMDAIGQLAGGIAHDFSNMLQAIFLEVALAQRTATGQTRAQLAEIKAVAQRAAGLTRQLLLFSRREQLQPRRLDLNDAVSSMARMLHRILGEDIALQIELAPGALHVQADPGMIDQVLLNLAVNARDAMPSGGTLSIATAEVDHAGADRPAGRYVRLEVRDTGDGIAEDVLPRIFEPFFTTKAPGHGTGLGLATAFGIVEQHGGWIDVASERGHGAKFTTYLPADHAPRADVAPEIVDGVRGHETILLVEDDDTVRAKMRSVLELHGYRVIEAERAATALEAWDRAEGGIDLVLTDVVMPGGMSGGELATRLVERRPGVKVLFATGYSHVRPSLAAAHVLDKPVTAEELVAAVRVRLDATT